MGMQNLLIGGVLYVGSIYFLYGGKPVAFKDSKEVDAMAILATRKGIAAGKAGSADRRRYREQKWARTKYAGDEAYAAAKKTYEAQKWVR